MRFSLCFVFFYLCQTEAGVGQILSKKVRYDWDLRAFDEKACSGVSDALKDAKFFIQKKGDDLYLFAPDPKPLLKIIKNDKDGIALEKVFYRGYLGDSITLGRVNGTSIFNGAVTQPMYSEALFEDLTDHFRLTEYDAKALRNQAKPIPYWMTYLGKDTIPGDGPFEYNLLFIKNESVCKVKYHKTQIGRLHDFYSGVNILPEWVEKELTIIPILKTFSFQVPFDRGQTTINNEQEALYTDVLDDFIVRGVKIWAYASVEGSAEINEALQKARAENIQASLKNYLPEKVAYRIIAKENWERFAEQLEGTSNDSLRRMSKSAIREILKKEDNLSAFDQELYDQRKAVVKVFYNTKPQDYDTVHILEHNFRQALDSIRIRKANNRPYSYYVQDARGLYSWLFDEMEKEKYAEDEFMKWQFPLDITYRSLINNRFWYQYYHPKYMNYMADNYIKMIGLDREASDTERLNLISYIYEKEKKEVNDSGLALEDLGRLMRSRAYHTLPRQELLRIAIPLFVDLAVHYNKDIDSWPRRDLMLNDLVTLFEQDSTKTSEDWLKLAETSAKLDNDFVANGILERFEDSENPGFVSLNLKLKSNLVDSNSEFTKEVFRKELIDAYVDIGRKNWCDLFNQEDGISFQTMDNDSIRKIFLENCLNELN